MPTRRLALVAALLAACSSSSTAVGGREEPALLRLGEQVARVDVPDAATLGTPLVVTVTTFGGGCVREAARAEVVPLHATQGGAAAVRLFNRHTGGEACTDDLRFIEHRVAVPVTSAGTLQLRIEGAARGAESNWQLAPWAITRVVVVR
ncbi:hypothetical protein [Roseisolibacter sp. H3M3-2]|uniref:hypothetical protein n=1 Tax=Roseisolibacter sp. H3M3-2 TaxID=3031323 RepID=UPI0023DB65C1|nr:hypothetical protein [Roseisolibacter sp. H3M3-2]MDF1505634.1 hypothetical protein [Roseisolibacter sp. H3M3-2]